LPRSVFFSAYPLDCNVCHVNVNEAFLVSGTISSRPPWWLEFLENLQAELSL
jgi:hypothetical protein